MLKEYFQDNRVVLYPGDCLDVLARLKENSIDSCLTDPPYHLTSIVKRFGRGGMFMPNGHGHEGPRHNPDGRWPANVIHDGGAEVTAGFPATEPRNDSGSAARFFYCAKANKKERAGSKHPTVKPIKLLRYPVRLVTPPGGIVLDPFAGTDTAGEAAWLEGARSILIEREQEYQEDIRRRLQSALAKSEAAE